VTPHTPLGTGKEFDAIRAMVARWGASADGIGDDAALLDAQPGESIAVSTDTSVENVHFRRAWLTPEEIGWRATTAALSDLAAVGARPLGVLTALTVPPSWRPELDALSSGIGAAVAAAGTRVIGGDLTSGGELSITVTVIGACTRPLVRAGARAGDDVWVTGHLGGPGLALHAWQSHREPPAAARARFARPEARIAAARWLADHGCTAAIDVSDGLVADARHVAMASGHVLTLHLDDVPCVDGADALAAAVSGEEYELLVTAAAGAIDAGAFARASGVALTKIGAVASGTPGVVVLRGGNRVEISAGHDHFSA